MPSLDCGFAVASSTAMVYDWGEQGSLKESVISL